MYVYRNLVFQNAVFGGDTDYEKESAIREMEPDEFTVLTYISHDCWKCEPDVIKHCRNCNGMFNFISDNRIKEILFNLSASNKVERKYIETDVGEEIVPSVQKIQTDEPNVIMKGKED